jgi:DNA-binding response OmpR family regulator
LKYYCEYYAFGVIQVVPKKILVVDEEAMLREFLEYLLGKAGYSVYTAASSEEAMQILSQESIPVTFIGLGLVFGELNGLELCEKIRKQDPNAIIYALTGYANLFHPHELRKAGFDNWFAKPVSIISIRQVLKDTFAKMDDIM